jgi:type I restriction enzyme S subunit
VATLESGHTPRKSVSEYWDDGDVPWISLRDIRKAHGKVIFQTESMPTKLGIENSSARILPAGTVCFSRDISVGFTTIMGTAMATTQHFANWICKSALSNSYLMFALIASQQNLLRSGEGTTVRTIYMPAIKRFHLALPPLNEQKRIVAKIEALQERSRAAKEALDRIPALLEKFRQSVLAAAFRGDLTRRWREQHPDVEPASVLLQRIRKERKARFIEDQAEKARAKAEAKARKAGKPWSEKDNEKALATERAKAEKKYNPPKPVDEKGLPKLPEGWCWASLEEVCWNGPTNGYSGKSTESAEGTLSMKLSATTQGKLILNSKTTKRLVKKVESESQFWLESGDLLIQRANSLQLLGAAAVYRGSDEKMIYPDLMMRVRLINDVITSIAWRYINSSACRTYFRTRATGTAGNMPKINGVTLKRTMLPVPPFKESGAITRTIEECFLIADVLSTNMHAVTDNLKSLNQSILSKAFRGELVPQDPNDEHQNSRKLKMKLPLDSSNYAVIVHTAVEVCNE